MRHSSSMPSVWLAAVQRVQEFRAGVRLGSGPLASRSHTHHREVARHVLETIGTDESAPLLVLCRLQENVLKSRVPQLGWPAGPPPSRCSLSDSYEAPRLLLNQHQSPTTPGWRLLFPLSGRQDSLTEPIGFCKRPPRFTSPLLPTSSTFPLTCLFAQLAADLTHGRILRRSAVEIFR